MNKIITAALLAGTFFLALSRDGQTRAPAPAGGTLIVPAFEFERPLDEVAPRTHRRVPVGDLETVAQDPEDLFHRAYVLGEAGRYSEAEETYTQLIKIAPKGDGAWINRGVVRCLQGRFVAGIEDFTQALAVTTKPAGVYAKRGMAWLDLGDRVKAREDLNRAVRLDPLLEKELRPLLEHAR